MAGLTRWQQTAGRAANAKDSSEALAYLNAVANTLATFDDLSPDNPEVTEVLQGFVSVLRAWRRRNFGDAFPGRSEFAHIEQSLPRLCGHAECLMEKWWCRRILASSHLARELRSFWYWHNYEALFDAEVRWIENYHNILFLGSGALPITAVMAASAFRDVRFRCVDCDGEACELSRKLVDNLGLGNRISIVEASAEDVFPELGEAVVCASLLDIGGDFGQLKLSKTARVLVRDVEGVFRFCYRQARCPTLPYVETGRTAASDNRLNITRCFDRPDLNDR